MGGDTFRKFVTFPETETNLGTKVQEAVISAN